MKKAKKKQFLKRSLRFMIRFNKSELRKFKSRAKESGLSQVEYGRRRILEIPIVMVNSPSAKAPAETSV